MKNDGRQIIEWPFESIRTRMDCLERVAFIRRTGSNDGGGVEIVDRQTGAVLHEMPMDELLKWWERLIFQIDSMGPPGLANNGGISDSHHAKRSEISA